MPLTRPASERTLTVCLLFFCISVLTRAAEVKASFPSPGVQVSQFAVPLRVEINSKLFTEYYFQNLPRPFLCPIHGHDGLPISWNRLANNVPGKYQSHPH